MSDIAARIAALSPERQALLATRLRSAGSDATPRREPLAIIGIGCRFPGGVETPEAFWQLLRNGVDAVSEIPRARWDIDAYYDANPDAAGKMYARQGAFLDRESCQSRVDLRCPVADGPACGPGGPLKAEPAADAGPAAPRAAPP